MTDLITEVYSTLVYILEEIANNVNNISTKYLPALVSNVSPTLLFYIGISLVIFIVCIYPERKSVKTKSVKKKQKDDTLIAKPTIKTTGFDIAPDDEVIFKSLVSQQEADAEIAKNSKKHIPMQLDTKEQINAFLDGEDITVSDLKKSKHDAIRKKIEKDMTDEDHKTEQEIQREQLAKIFSLLKEQELASEEEFQSQLRMYQK